MIQNVPNVQGLCCADFESSSSTELLSESNKFVAAHAVLRDSIRRKIDDLYVIPVVNF
jgi:hypothetical protein